MTAMSARQLFQKRLSEARNAAHLLMIDRDAELLILRVAARNDAPHEELVAIAAECDRLDNAFQDAAAGWLAIRDNL